MTSRVFFRVVLATDGDADAAVVAVRKFPCTRVMTTRAPTREVQGVAEVSEDVLTAALRQSVPGLVSLEVKAARSSAVVEVVEGAVRASASDGKVERTDLDPGLRQEIGDQAALIEAVFKARVPGGVLVVTAGLSANPSRSELSVVVADTARARSDADGFLADVQQHLDDAEDVAVGHHVNAHGTSFLVVDDPLLRAAGVNGWRLVALTDDELALVRSWDGAQFGVELTRVHPTLSSSPRPSILADEALAKRLRERARTEGSSLGRLTLKQLLVLDVAGGIEVRLSRKDALALAAALRTTRVQSAPFVVEGPNAAIAFRPRSPAGCHRADESRLLLVDVPPEELESLADWLLEPLGLGPVPGLSVYSR